MALFAAYAGRAASRVPASTRELFCRFSMSLVPLGVATWAGHFLFHFAVGWDSVWPTLRRVARSNGWPLINSPDSEFSSPLLGADGIRTLQTVLLDAGFLMALYLGWRISLAYAPRARDALRLFAPWAGVATSLYALGVWIFLQQMELRGMPGTTPVR